MKEAEFIANGRFQTVVIDGFLYEKINGEIFKLIPLGKGSGAYVLSECSKWIPYQYHIFSDVLHEAWVHPNDYIIYGYRYNGKSMSDVPTNAVFTDNPVELNGFVQNLAEEDFHMAKDYIWMLQRFYCYQTIRDMIPAYIMNRVRDMHELKWEMVQLLNSSSSVIERFDENPALIFIVAASRHLLPADELPITIYEKEILEKLGITDCITALELFSKIIPAFYTVKAFRSILGILKSENTEMIDFLLKTEKLEGEILSCCANGVSPSLAKEIHNCGTHTPDYYDLLDKIIRYEKLSKILSLRYEYYCKPYEQIHSIKELDNDTAEAELYLEYEKGKIHNQQAGADYYIMRPSVTFHQLTCSGLRQMSERLSQSDISIIEYNKDNAGKNIIKATLSYDVDSDLWGILDYKYENTDDMLEEIMHEFVIWLQS